MDTAPLFFQALNDLGENRPIFGRTWCVNMLWRFFLFFKEIKYQGSDAGAALVNALARPASALPCHFQRTRIASVSRRESRAFHSVCPLRGCGLHACVGEADHRFGAGNTTAMPPLSSSRAAVARANTNSCSGVVMRQAASWVLVQKRSRVGSSASSALIGMIR